MTSFVKNIIKIMLTASGYYSLRYSIKTSRNKKLLILMYHDIIKEGTPRHKSALAIKSTDKTFEANLKALKNFRVMPLEDATKEMKCEEGLREDSIAITFDDGYRSMYELAYPLLKKYNLPATVFITNDWINGKMILWWETLEDMIVQTNFSNISWNRLRQILYLTKDNKERLFNNSFESKSDFFQWICPLIMRSSNNDQKRIIKELKKMLLTDPNNTTTSPRPLDWNQIIEMSQNKINFGAHTCSHLNLSFSDLEEAKEEIVSSKREIEAKTNILVSGFAYPYGCDYEGYKKIKALLEKHNFDYAVVAIPGNNNVYSDFYRLFRISAPSNKAVYLSKREYYLGLTSSPPTPISIDIKDNI